MHSSRATNRVRIRCPYRGIVGITTPARAFEIVGLGHARWTGPHSIRLNWAPDDPDSFQLKIKYSNGTAVVQRVKR